VKIFKLETLAAAVTAACGVALAGPAYSAIDTDNYGSLGGGTGNGEVVLSVGERDVNSNEVRSYTRDLGLLAMTDFVGVASNPASHSFAADANLQAFLAAVNPANSVFYTVTAIYNPPSFEGGFLTSAPAFPPNNPADPKWDNFNQTQTQDLGTYYNAVNALTSGANASLYLPAGDLNLGSSASYFGISHSGGNYAGYPTGTTLGADAAFFADIFGPSFTGEFVEIQGLWNLNATSGLLTFNPSIVPLPAGIWLLGAGFLAYLGVNRRSS